MNVTESTVWQEILSRTRAVKEKQLIEELRHTACQLTLHMQFVQQSRTVSAQYEAVWRQLLVCRRSELMCCIPLTSQRISQLQTVAASAAVTADQFIGALQSGISTLTAFVTVNKSTAEELQHDPATAALAKDKYQLSLLEEGLATSLQQLVDSSKLRLAAAPAMSQSMQQQQCATPTTSQQQQQQQQQQTGRLQRTDSALRSASSVTHGDSPATGAAAVNQQLAPAHAALSAAEDLAQQHREQQQQQVEHSSSQQQQIVLRQNQQLQQQSLEQQQQLLQQRQQQLESQLLQMGQLLQQQQQSICQQQEHNSQQSRDCIQHSRDPIISRQHNSTAQQEQQQECGQIQPQHLGAHAQQSPLPTRFKNNLCPPAANTAGGETQQQQQQQHGQQQQLNWHTLKSHPMLERPVAQQREHQKSERYTTDASDGHAAASYPADVLTLKNGSQAKLAAGVAPV